MLLCEGTVGGLYELEASAGDVSFWGIIDDMFAYIRLGENKTMTLLDTKVLIGNVNFAKVLLPSGVIGYIWHNAPVCKLTG